MSCVSHRHISCILSPPSADDAPEDEKCNDCGPCAPCNGCVALPAPYNEGLSSEGILALVGIGNGSKNSGDDSLSGEVLLKRLLGKDFELSIRTAPECGGCSDCLPCIDCCEYLERGLGFFISFGTHLPCMLSYHYLFACFA